MIIKPQSLEHDDLINIEVSDDEIECHTAAYNEAFYQIIKNYDFKWSGLLRKWIKKVVLENIQNRTAEIGYILLLEGFVVSINDQEIARKIQTNDFQYEPTRVIDVCSFAGYENYLTVSWKREDLYSCVRHNLYGSKYIKKHKAIVVPLYFYEEIYDVADDYGFLITEAARAKIEEGRKNVMTLFNLEAPVKKNKTVFHAPKKLEPKRSAIHDNLKDQPISASI